MTKDDLLKMENLPEGVLADLTALFSDVEERDREISTLRQKTADADEIVKRAPELEKLTKEQGEKITLLNTELAKYTSKPSDDGELYGIFKPFFTS